MVTITAYCPHCQSDALVRTGRAPDGKQKCLCRACHRQIRDDPAPHAFPEERREEILSTYQERSSLRGLERTIGVSRTTILAWIKKVARLPPLSETLIVPDPTDLASLTLELDELWSFVAPKTN